jgi:serine/threonine protein phosphatase PrpC
MKLNHYSKTVIGLVRKGNEDSIGNITTPNNSNINLYIVCDGMGGHIGGAKASGIAVDSILEYFKNSPDPVPQNALKEAISFANVQIFGSAQADTQFKGMGTTCTVLLESEGLIYIAHVGDSRIYLNTDGKLFRITKDHSYVQGLVDNGEITDQQMETHPRKNELTRALGIGVDVQVEVASKPILAKIGDKFMLCSDGLNGLINDKMIAAVINSKESLPEQCHQLIYLAESAGGHDNISVDLIEVSESEHTKTQFVNKNNEDLISSKTQRITPIQKEKKTSVVALLKSKLALLLLGVLGVLILVFLPTDTPSGEGIIIVEKKPITLKKEKKIVIIKAIAKAGDGELTLNTDLYNKIPKDLQENYKKDKRDSPLFFRKKNPTKPISIHNYRNLKEDLQPGDFLMITITDGKIDMPEINRKEPVKVIRDKNISSEEEAVVQKAREEKVLKRKAKTLEEIIKENKRKTATKDYDGFTVLFEPEKEFFKPSKDTTYTVRVTFSKNNFKDSLKFKETVKASPKPKPKVDTLSNKKNKSVLSEVEIGKSVKKDSLKKE